MWRLVVCFPEKVEVFAFLSLLAPTASVTGHREMPALMCFLWPAQEVFFYPRKSRISNTFRKPLSIGFVIVVTIKSLTGQHWRCLVVFWEYELMLETDATLDTAAKHSEQTVCVCQRSPQTLQNYYIVWFSKNIFYKKEKIFLVWGANQHCSSNG